MSDKSRYIAPAAKARHVAIGKGERLLAVGDEAADRSCVFAPLNVGDDRVAAADPIARKVQARQLLRRGVGLGSVDDARWDNSPVRQVEGPGDDLVGIARERLERQP